MTDTAVETTGLGRRYGKNWALRDCSLRLPAGRIAALLGPNGAGKTTLLQLLVGLSQPSAGRVTVFGQAPGSREVLDRIGFVAQDTPLYRDFTPAELIEMGRRLNRAFDVGLARDRLDQLGIAADRAVGKMSGGQRAQVALTLALAKRPRLLLLDEPVASLDPLARREFLQALMGGVADEGTTVLLSSHLLGDLERVCDHLIVLNAGRVQVLGGVEELVADHRLLVGAADLAPHGLTVVQERRTDRQASLLVRGYDPTVTHIDPQWTVHDVSLEDLVLAYLANGAADALPGPVGVRP
ncbi:ABC transporter ATP-binding protein [Virgisporangium ochraceum]